MTYAQYGGQIINQGCGSLVYTPDFFPLTLKDGLVSRPTDDAEFKSAEGLKFIIDTPEADDEGSHQFNLNLKSDMNNALFPQFDITVKLNVLKACQVETLDTKGQGFASLDLFKGDQLSLPF